MFKNLKLIGAVIGFTIFSSLTGCMSYRWHGGTLDAAIFDTKPEKKYFIESITFNSDVDISTAGISAYCKPWYFAKTANEKEYLSELMSLAPEVFSDDPSAEHISVNFKVVKASRNEHAFGFLITLGAIWPIIDTNTAELETTITSSNNTGNASRIAFKEELWMGEPWTLAVYFLFPDRDESLSDSLTERFFDPYANVNNQKFKRAQQKVLAKAIIKLLK